MVSLILYVLGCGSANFYRKHFPTTEQLTFRVNEIIAKKSVLFDILTYLSRKKFVFDQCATLNAISYFALPVLIFSERRHALFCVNKAVKKKRKKKDSRSIFALCVRHAVICEKLNL